jgi:uncharacterized repeat protein (TIGR04052 family)
VTIAHFRCVIVDEQLENNMKSSKKLGAIFAALALGLVGLIALPVTANAHGGHAKKSKTQKVAIGFKAVNGNTPVSCSKPITGLGTTSRTAKLTDLRFYVSGVQLLRKGGGAVRVKLQGGSKWSYTKGKDAVTLIDLENGAGACSAEGTKATNAFVRGTVPKGRYVGVRYSVSVPDSLSHTDLTAMPSPLNNTAMGWSWQYGRKFMKIELGQGDTPDWASPIYYLHLGSTNCTGDPAAGEQAKCDLPNQNLITFRKFNPAGQRIAIDFKKLFSGVNVAGESMDMGDGMDMGGMMAMGGCMSATDSPDCDPLFETLGLKLGSTKRTNQTAFRVVRK